MTKFNKFNSYRLIMNIVNNPVIPDSDAVARATAEFFSSDRTGIEGQFINSSYDPFLHGGIDAQQLALGNITMSNCILHLPAP